MLSPISHGRGTITLVSQRTQKVYASSTLVLACLRWCSTCTHFPKSLKKIKYKKYLFQRVIILKLFGRWAQFLYFSTFPHNNCLKYTCSEFLCFEAHVFWFLYVINQNKNGKKCVRFIKYFFAWNNYHYHFLEHSLSLSLSEKFQDHT